MLKTSIFDEFASLFIILENPVIAPDFSSSFIIAPASTANINIY